LTTFQDARVAVLRADGNTVREVVAAHNEDRLQELTEGCNEAYHQEHTKITINKEVAEVPDTAGMWKCKNQIL